MSSADFCTTITSDLSGLSESYHMMQISRGKTLDFHNVDAGFIKQSPVQMEDFMVTYPLVSAVSHLISDSCLSSLYFGLGLTTTDGGNAGIAGANPRPSDKTSWMRPCPSPNLRLCEYLVRGLPPL